MFLFDLLCLLFCLTLKFVRSQDMALHLLYSVYNLTLGSFTHLHASDIICFSLIFTSCLSHSYIHMSTSWLLSSWASNHNTSNTTLLIFYTSNSSWSPPSYSLWYNCLLLPFLQSLHISNCVSYLFYFQYIASLTTSLCHQLSSRHHHVLSAQAH